jgi:hypothetical protein
MEVDEAPIKDGATSFQGEDAVMMIFGRQPSSEKHHVLHLSTESHHATAMDGGTWECKDINFSCTLMDVRKNIYAYVYLCTPHTSRARKNKGEERPAKR